MPFARHMDMYVTNILAGCDGRRTLRELIVVTAGSLQADPEQFTPACLEAVRKLMQSGFLSAVGESAR
ncbi:MAG: hypothetical protein ACYSUP_00105 [Planctomycetota bacterium]